jgi:hypothetical protein
MDLSVTLIMRTQTKLKLVAGHGLCDADTNMPWDIVCVVSMLMYEMMNRNYTCTQCGDDTLSIG